jgi:hypothetical protein
LRDAGAAVHGYTVQLCVRALIICAEKPELLSCDDGEDGKFSASRQWAYAWLKRHDFTVRKATKATPKKNPDPKVIQGFQHRVALAVSEHKIPKELCANFDQTACYLVPVAESTFNSKGSKQVSIRFSGDKRNITALLSGSATGHFLPEQLIFQGKTDRCHPAASLPNSWVVSHSTTHWSSDDTMKEWMEKIAIPWREKCIFKLHLPQKQRALLIFDCWSKHKTKWWLDLCKSSGFEVVFVPGNCIY